MFVGLVYFLKVENKMEERTNLIPTNLSFYRSHQFNAVQAMDSNMAKVKGKKKKKREEKT